MSKETRLVVRSSIFTILLKIRQVVYQLVDLVVWCSLVQMLKNFLLVTLNISPGHSPSVLFHQLVVRAIDHGCRIELWLTIP